MAAFTLTHTQRKDNVAILQTLEPTEVSIGQSITVTGNAAFNGTYVVYDVPQYLFQGVDEYGDYLFDYEIIILNQLFIYLELLWSSSSSSSLLSSGVQ